MRVTHLGTEARGICLHWEDGQRSRYHYVWLRDNCRCDLCRHWQVGDRLLDSTRIPLDLRPQSVELAAPDLLEIAWPPHGDMSGHESHFDLAWLRAHRPSRAERLRQGLSRTTWDAAFAARIPELAYARVTSDDGALLAWLRVLHEYGVSLIRGVPCRPGEVGRVAEAIGCIRSSHYGTIFDVESKPKPNALAYTAHALLPHTDLPYRELQPRLQLLHCLLFEAQGGDSQLVDGFHAAEHLRDTDPAGFDLLASTPVLFRQLEAGADLSIEAPMIRLDDQERVAEIRFSNAKLQPFDVPHDQVIPLYRAYFRFAALLRDPAHMVRLRLAPGDQLAFDNGRVLHGRTAYDPQSGARHLQGCYLDSDDLLSRIRVLERAQAATPPEPGTLAAG